MLSTSLMRSSGIVLIGRDNMNLAIDTTAKSSQNFILYPNNLNQSLILVQRFETPSTLSSEMPKITSTNSKKGTMQLSFTPKRIDFNVLYTVPLSLTILSSIFRTGINRNCMGITLSSAGLGNFLHISTNLFQFPSISKLFAFGDTRETRVHLSLMGILSKLTAASYNSLHFFRTSSSKENSQLPANSMSSSLNELYAKYRS